MSNGFATGQVTVTTSPTYVTTGVVGMSRVYVHAPQGNNLIYLGNSTVTTTTGFEIVKNQVLEFWLPEGQELYAIVNTATEPLIWMRSGGK